MPIAADALNSAATLSTYDPDWETKWTQQYERALDLWRQAVREMHEEGKVRAETKQEWRATLAFRHKARQRRDRTPADIARRVFNIVAGRAALLGERFDPDKAPNPESFGTIREVRLFLMEEMQRLKEAKSAKVLFTAYSLPVAPQWDQGLPFHDGDSPSLYTQAVHIPDIDGGFDMMLRYEHKDEDLSISISSPMDPKRLRTHLPRVATLLMERMFAADDPMRVTFYVHHPVGQGPAGSEQFWKYDLRPDSLNRFHFAGRTMMPLVPHGIAYARAAIPDRLLNLDSRVQYAPGVEMLVRKHERDTDRIHKIRDWQRLRKMRGLHAN